MEKQKPWILKARKCLEASLIPVPHELNELDWKLSLSEKGERMAQHIAAFANHPGGGFFVFGLAPSGDVRGIEKQEVEKIIHKLANISRDSLEPPQKIDHCIDKLLEKNILFVHVPESSQKPVHLRGKGLEYSYIRSGGQTRKMGRQEMAQAILQSRQVRFEEMEALSCDAKTVLNLLDYEKVFELLNLSLIESPNAILDQLINHKLVYRKNKDFSITNLGAIAAARDLLKFPGKESFSVRVIKYRGTSRMETEGEKEFFSGYGVGFQQLIRYIMELLPTSEIIKDALRKNVPIYPEITVRELVANALIHRDFSISSTHPMIEIFKNRLEILNPGILLPSVSIERIIDSAPESRNEIFASLMRRMGICEERGSGIDKALFAVELYGLPPIDFVNGPNMFKAILYSPKDLKEMSPQERLQACYQHCCLKFVSGERMTNTTFRKRLGLKDSQYTAAWRVIDSAMEQDLIKIYEPKIKARKFASYIPFWA